MTGEFAYKRLFGPFPTYRKVEDYFPPYQNPFITVAGPCSVENAEQIHMIASSLGKLGIEYLRGGIFRVGTYPGSKFGLVDEVLIHEFSRAAHENGMKTVIEVLDYHPETIMILTKYADAFQVGARAMQNYMLLRILGQSKRTVFLKRHPGSTMDEFLGSAEHLLAGGLCDPILVERGSSTHMNHVRWDLSISIIPAIKAITKMPIIIDPSHGTGRRDLVEPMALAGIAAGADGFLIETHPNPDKSLSDPDQAYPLEEFDDLYKKIFAVKVAIDKHKYQDNPTFTMNSSAQTSTLP